MKKKLFIVISLILIAGGITIKRQKQSHDVTIANHPLSLPIELHGHRGARGLYPENSLIAYETAAKLGVDTIELDVTLTADKKLIAYHNIKINTEICRNEDGSKVKEKKIAKMKVKEVQALDCGLIGNSRFSSQKKVKGTHPPLLSEVFSHLKKVEKYLDSPLKYNLEVKFKKKSKKKFYKKVAKILLKQLKKDNLIARVTIQSFYLKFLKVIKKLEPKLRRSALFKPSYFQGLLMLTGFGDHGRNKIIEKTLRIGAEVISPYKMFVTPEFVRRAHEAGLKVIPWTVNSKEDLRTFMNYGVDGIISDYPDRLIEVYKKFIVKFQSS